MALTQRDVSKVSLEEVVPQRPSTTRYRVLGLTFLMAFMMYMERGAIGAAAPSIMREFHVNKITMGWSISAFNWSYALFQVPGGWLADRFGARIVLTVSMLWWSVFTAATGLTFSVTSLAATRFLFGVGEAAAFPSGSRALLNWLPVARRAFGQGFQHSGSRLGAALAPAMVMFLIARSGWRIVFMMFGAVGILWAIGWFLYYRNSPCEHSGVNRAELALISNGVCLSPVAKASVPWRLILRSTDVWLLSLTYFCYGCVLWLYLAWLPTYLQEARHFSLTQSGLAGVPLLAATLTNVLGGLFSDALSTRWRDIRRGRVYVAVFGFGLASLMLVPGVASGSPVMCLSFLTLALASLELTVPVSWAMAIDLGGEFSGSVSSVMNTCGNLGGAFSAVAVGYLATSFGWTAPFMLASSLCLVSALLASRIDPLRAIPNTAQI
jgi:MFS family permease